MPTSAESHPRCTAGAPIAVAILCGATIPVSIVMGRASLAIAVVLIAVAVAVAAWSGSRWPVLAEQSRPPLMLCGLVLAFWLPSVAGSLDPLISLGTLARVAALLVAGAALWSFLAVRPEAGEVVLKVFVIGMVLAGLFILASMTVAPSLVAFRTAAKPRPEMQFKASASLIACSFPVLVYVGWRLGRRWLAAAALAVGLGMFAIHATHSRSALAGVLVAACVVALVVLTRRLGRPAAVALWSATVLAAVGILVWLFSQVPLEWHGDYTVRLPAWIVDAHRQVIWQFTFDRFLDRPWLGWGVNMINHAPGAGEHIPGIAAEFIPSHPHSWVLQVMSETGLIGFLPTAGMVIAVAVVAAAAWVRNPSPQRLAWLSLWCAFWVSSAFNFSFWAAWWQTAVVILAVLVLAPLRERT